MNDIRFPGIPSIVLALSCISLSTPLVASTMCRNALYLAFALSIVDLLIKRPKVIFNQFTLIFFALLLLVITLYLPTIFLHSSVHYTIDLNYVITSKRLFFGSVILIYLALTKDRLSEKSWMVANSLIVIGFIYSSVIALKIYYENFGARLEIVTVSTMTAYIYILQSLCTLYILSQLKYRKTYLLLALVFSLSYYIVFLTQTRSAMLTYPIFTVVFLLKNKFFNIKTITIIALFSCVIVVFNLSSIKNALERMAYSVNEVQNYERNDGNTSLGARFSLWKSGLTSFKENPWGESADRRNIIAEKYIMQFENGNPEALRCLPFHFHNDFVEMLSLRGIIGGAILILFILVLSISAYKITNSINIHILLIAPTFVYGLTDTLLIDVRYVTIFILLLSFYLLVPKSTKKKLTD